MAYRSSSSANNNGEWSFEEKKKFEKALISEIECYEEELLVDYHSIWNNIGNELGRTAQEVERHYNNLVHEIELIETNQVQLPKYHDDSSSDDSAEDVKKGKKWSHDEHSLFLIGLTCYGMGDWRSISRQVVTTRSSTQVRSHAQKFFGSVNKEVKQNTRRRSRMQDFTQVDDIRLEELRNKGLISQDMIKQFLENKSYVSNLMGSLARSKMKAISDF